MPSPPSLPIAPSRRSALVVGAGASGLLHALALRAAGVAIGTIFDPDPARAELLASLVGGAATDDFGAARATAAEVVAICSPPLVHVDQAEALARPGRLTFVEKPVAVDPNELARLRRLPGVVPIVQWRAGRAAAELRHLFRGGVFGTAPRIALEMRLCRGDDYFAAGRRGRARWGCGAMLSIGIHAVDLLVWVVGAAILHAENHRSTIRAGLDVPTGAGLSITFAGGSSAEVRVNLEADGPSFVRLGVDGERASAWLTAGEGDPTAAPLSFRGIDPAALVGAGGTVGSPLLVPFIHEALAAFDAGGCPLTIDDVAEAHAIAFGCEPSRAREPVRFTPT